MTVLGVVLPTVDGRETLLGRAFDSHRKAPAELGVRIRVKVVRGFATCGEAWNAGAAELELEHGEELEWLLFTADDLIADPRWAMGALARATNGRRELPAPQLFLEDGRRDPRCDDGPDGVAVSFSRVPFLPAAAWFDMAPMPPLHYYSDVWVGDRLRERGWTFHVTAAFRFVHLWAAAGRHHDRDELDRRIYEDDSSRGARRTTRLHSRP